MKSSILILFILFFSIESFANSNINNIKERSNLKPVKGNDSELITKNKTKFIKESIQLQMDNHYASKENYLYLEFENIEEESDWIDFSLPYDCNGWKNINNKQPFRVCKIDQVQSLRSYNVELSRNYIKDMNININKRTIEREQYINEVAPTNVFENRNKNTDFNNVNVLNNKMINEDIKKEPIYIDFHVDYDQNISNVAKINWTSKHADFCLVDLGHYGEEYGTSGNKKIAVNHTGDVIFFVSCRNQYDVAHSQYTFINDNDSEKGILDGWFDIPNEMIIDKKHPIYWNFSEATECNLYLNDSLISTQNKGYIQKSLHKKGSYIFLIECKNEEAEFRDSREIVVNNKNSTIKVNFNTPESVNINDTFRVTWKADNAEECVMHYDSLYHGKFKAIDTTLIRPENKGFVPIRLECSNTSDSVVKLHNILVE